MVAAIPPLQGERGRGGLDTSVNMLVLRVLLSLIAKTLPCEETKECVWGGSGVGVWIGRSPAPPLEHLAPWHPPLGPMGRAACG